MSKHFVLNPSKELLTKEDITSIEQDRVQRIGTWGKNRESIAENAIVEEDNLKCTDGRVVIKINLQGKNYYSFENGAKIRLERQFNNFNRRESEPVNAIVIDGQGIPKHSEILIHPNSIHDSNKIFSYKDKSPDVGYYSIKTEECFLYNNGNGWQSIPPYETALRIFKPYFGTIQGIEPELLKNVLYVTSGDLKGKVVSTVKAADYQIVFQDSNGREGNIIRFRPHGEKKSMREPEAIAVMDELTDKVYAGELFVGITIKDCKIIGDFPDKK